MFREGRQMHLVVVLLVAVNPSPCLLSIHLVSADPTVAQSMLLLKGSCSVI